MQDPLPEKTSSNCLGKVICNDSDSLNPRGCSSGPCKVPTYQLQRFLRRGLQPADPGIQKLTTQRSRHWNIQHLLSKAWVKRNNWSKSWTPVISGGAAVTTWQPKKQFYPSRESSAPLACQILYSRTGIERCIRYCLLSALTSTFSMLPVSPPSAPLTDAAGTLQNPAASEAWHRGTVSALEHSTDRSTRVPQHAQPSTVTDGQKPTGRWTAEHCKLSSSPLPP